MKEAVFPFDPQREFLTPEGCFILELSNTAEDPAASIARARVVPGTATRLLGIKPHTFRKRAKEKFGL